MRIDAFGNALGNSIVGAIQEASEPAELRRLSPSQRAEAEGLAANAGVDLRNPEARAVILRAVDIRNGAQADNAELSALTSDYLRLAGASQDQVNDVIGSYFDKGVLKSNVTFTFGENRGGSPTGAASVDPGKSFISPEVDSVLIGTGELATAVAQGIKDNPALKYTLIGLDVAAGPAAFAVREAISASPIGTAIRSAESTVADFVSGQLEDAGRTQEQSLSGGVGALTLGNTVLLGVAGSVKGIGQALSQGYQRRLLGQRLEAFGQTSGDSRYIRGAGEEAHHIVPLGDPLAANARSTLDEFGIDINSVDNGAFLPKGINTPNPLGKVPHSATFTDSYASYVDSVISQATSRTEALDLLRGIREQLLTGKVPGQ